MLPRADHNRQVNVSRKRMQGKKEREEEEREENNTASDNSRE
jgi:hypothetical protein